MAEDPSASECWAVSEGVACACRARFVIIFALVFAAEDAGAQISAELRSAAPGADALLLAWAAEAGDSGPFHLLKRLVPAGMRVADACPLDPVADLYRSDVTRPLVLSRADEIVGEPGIRVYTLVSESGACSNASHVLLHAARPVSASGTWRAAVALPWRGGERTLAELAAANPHGYYAVSASRERFWFSLRQPDGSWFPPVEGFSAAGMGVLLEMEGRETSSSWDPRRPRCVRSWLVVGVLPPIARVRGWACGWARRCPTRSRSRAGSKALTGRMPTVTVAPTTAPPGWFAEGRVLSSGPSPPSTRAASCGSWVSAATGPAALHSIGISTRPTPSSSRETRARLHRCPGCPTTWRHLRRAVAPTPMATGRTTAPSCFGSSIRPPPRVEVPTTTGTACPTRSTVARRLPIPLRRMPMGTGAGMPAIPVRSADSQDKRPPSLSHLAPSRSPETWCSPPLFTDPRFIGLCARLAA